MSRLIAFGDSFAYGQGLNGVNSPHTHAHSGAWPTKLADTLGLECINQAKPGASNKLIWYLATLFDIRPDDVVVFGWSCPQRHLIFNKYLTDTYSGQLSDLINYAEPDADFSQIGNWMIDTDPRANAYYTHIYTPEDSWMSTLMQMSHIDLLIKQVTPYVIHTSIGSQIEFFELSSDSVIARDGNPVSTNGGNVKPKWFDIDIVQTFDYELASIGELPDGHPDQASHDSFAKRLNHKILSLYPELTP